LRFSTLTNHRLWHQLAEKLEQFVRAIAEGDSESCGAKRHIRAGFASDSPPKAVRAIVKGDSDSCGAKRHIRPDMCNHELNLVQFYSLFIKTFEERLNQLALIRICIHIAHQIQGTFFLLRNLVGIL
jgi:hypothetical protein